MSRAGTRRSTDSYQPHRPRGLGARPRTIASAARRYGLDGSYPDPSACEIEPLLAFGEAADGARTVRSGAHRRKRRNHHLVRFSEARTRSVGKIGRASPRRNPLRRPRQVVDECSLSPFRAAREKTRESHSRHEEGRPQTKLRRAGLGFPFAPRWSERARRGFGGQASGELHSAG